MLFDQLLYFVITIGILVFIHEFGHFAAAKLSRMRVEIFSIGFGYRLFGWNKTSGFSAGPLPKDFDGGDNTDYRLCLLPLGGYVKIAGMVDESGDTSFAEKEPQPYEFRSKSASKKIFVISAGVIMNLLLSYFIFWGNNAFVGKTLTKTTTVGVVEAGSAAEKAGFKAGDRIKSINGVAVNYWEDIRAELYVHTLGKDVTFIIDRAQQEITLPVARKKITGDDGREIFLLTDNLRPAIADILKDSPADSAGIKPGDVFLSINGVPLQTIAQVISTIGSLKGEKIKIATLRNHDTLLLTATPGKDGKIGIKLGGYAFLGSTEKRTNSVFESFGLAGNDIVKTVGLTFTMIQRVFTGELAFNKAFGGPIKIAQYAARSADSGVANFIIFLGLLSLSLAILNILPLPALDGGHLVMIIVERIMKREIPIKLKLAIQNAGFFLLLALMAFILYNDFRSL